MSNLPVLSVASPMKNMEIPKETYKSLNIQSVRWFYFILTL